MKKIIIIAFTLFFSILVNAQPASSTIALGGGIAAPTQTLKISIQKLIQNISYNVTCDIIAPQSTNDDPTIARLYLDSNVTYDTEILLNGVNIGYNSQVVIPGKSSKLSFIHVINYNNMGALAIQNADQQNKINVDNCVAVAMS